jgi:hypothetical protein
MTRSLLPPLFWLDAELRLVERWRTGDQPPELVTTTLDWRPAGATSPFALDVELFFAEVHGKR